MVINNVGKKRGKKRIRRKCNKIIFVVYVGLWEF